MKPDVFPGIARPEDLTDAERVVHRHCGDHLTLGGPEFCVFCLRARADGYYAALLSISEQVPCLCSCGEHEDAIAVAKTALAEPVEQ